MGKSTVSAFLSSSEIGVPVLCADEVVHALYSAGGAAVAPVGAAFPDAVVDGAIDRTQLSKYVVGNDAAMKQLEGIVHPLVEAERRRFIQQVHKAVLFVVNIMTVRLYKNLCTSDAADIHCG